jgi:hypothetical protein
MYVPGTVATCTSVHVVYSSASVLYIIYLFLVVVHVICDNVESSLLTSNA